MTPFLKTAVLWGAIIGIANMLWLYAGYYLGLHTNGPGVFQIFMAGWLIVSGVGYVLALRAVKRAAPPLGYLRGLGAGAVASVVSAIIAVLAQVGYFKVVNPAWPETMAQQTREYFTAQGMTPEDVERAVENSRAYFTLTNYAIQSAVAAVVIGVFFSAIIMIFVRSRRAGSPTAGA